MSETTKNGKLYAVSNAHLDTQWNWTIVDTIRDCIKNTMEYNFELFKNYPGYKMNFEGAFRYKLMKEYYPEKYKKVKKYVKEGKWNPVGAAWDSMDVNVPSGEALMRQILLGNNYFEKEFGIVTKDIFLPDCFGFRASLPSIEAHMGLNGFSTQKLVWGVGAPRLSPDGKVLPPMLNSDLPQMDLGRWRGPDGKSIFVSLLEGSYSYDFDNKGDERPIDQREEYAKAIEHNKKYAGVARRSMYFGTGDYGGSCNKNSARMLQRALEHKDGKGNYEVIAASPTDIYEGLTEEEINALPVYEGGLLIPHGYGAMTSHTAMKRLNRYNELLADRTERASVAARHIAAEPYPKKKLDEAWKTFLWHQFHDDITGTSIADAYVFSHNDLLLARNLFTGELQNALSTIEKRLDTRGKGTPYVVYNPSAFTRKEAFALPFEGEFACAYKGKAKLPTAVYEENGKKKAVFSATLSPMSFTVIHIREEKHRYASSLRVKKTLLENDCLKVRFDTKGNVCSVYDKRLNKELLRAPVRFEIYPDSSTTWPSWEYTLDDLKKKPVCPEENIEIEMIDRRPLCVGMKITKTFGRSRFETTILLEEGSGCLKFENKVQWYERASNLFVSFPLTAENEYTLFDSDPGAVKGGITDSYPYFMHNVHKWADQKDTSGDYGVLIANDCKYGMIKPDKNTLALALIHTPKAKYLPKSGQDWQDFGTNLFSFTLEGYQNDRTEAIRHAEALNNPLTAVKGNMHKGNAESLSFLELSGSGAVLTAVKEEEKGDMLILRVRETEGTKEQDIRIDLPLCTIKNLYACDGYERIGEELEHGEKGFVFDLEKYETKTFALKLENPTTRRVKDLPVELPLNSRLFRNRKEKGDSEFSLPLELASEKELSMGTNFKVSTEENNVCRCKGQTVELPESAAYLRIIAASTNGRKEVGFLLDGEEKTVSVAPMHEPVGSIESVVSGVTSYVTKDPVAAVYTHTYNRDGEDNLYDFAYFFTYELPLNGAKTLTLPEDESIVLLSAVTTDRKICAFATEQYDHYETDVNSAKHHLTAEGCQKGDGDYAEGALVLLYAPTINKSAIFEDFEGEGIVRKEGNFAVVQMGNRNLSVKARYKSLGENLAKGKPCTANNEVNSHECAAKALDGDSQTKWCGNWDENHICTLTVDLQEVKEISSYLICHAGTMESKHWNTADFEILVKKNSEDEWIVVDSVNKNQENITHRSFEKQYARYVMLRITKPTKSGDSHARIYDFEIFK